MKSNITTPCLPELELETAEHLFDNWFDPIEAALRGRVRDFIEAMNRGRAGDDGVAAALWPPCEGVERRSEGAEGATGHRHGHRHGHRSRAVLSMLFIPPLDISAQLIT